MHLHFVVIFPSSFDLSLRIILDVHSLHLYLILKILALSQLMEKKLKSHLFYYVLLTASNLIQMMIKHFGQHLWVTVCVIGAFFSYWLILVPIIEAFVTDLQYFLIFLTQYFLLWFFIFKCICIKSSLKGIIGRVGMEFHYFIMT